MSTETQPVPAPQDQLHLPAEYDFMSLDKIKARRDDQREAQAAAAKDALKSNDIYQATKEGQQQLLDNVDADAEAYVAEHIKREDNPELFDRLKALVAGTSYYHMDGVEWNLGEADEHGKHTKLETSGQDQYENALKELFGTKTEEPEPVPDEPPLATEERRTAAKALRETREELAKLSVQRRQLIAKRSDKAYRLETEYLLAQKEYKAATKAVGILLAKKWRKDGTTGDELLAKVVHALQDEHQAFSLKEQEYMAKDNRLRAKVARWMAGRRGRTSASMLAAGSIGYGAKWAAKSILGAAIITNPIALGAGLAINAARGAYTASVGNLAESYHRFKDRQKEDHDTLEQAGHELKGDDDTALIDGANGLLQSTLNKRVEADRSANFKRTRTRMILGGAAVAAGVLFETLGEHLGWTGHGSHSTKAGKISGSGPHPNTTNPPSGGKGGVVPPVGPAHPAPQPGVVDGYQSNVHIAHGEGYQQAVHDLAAQKHIDLSDNQSWQLYEHLNAKFHGSFFSNDPSYRMPNPGEWGISHAGAAHWNPAVIHEMNRWMIENGHQDKLSTLTSATKKVTKHAAKAALAARIR